MASTEVLRWPSDASQDYVEARKKLLDAEKALSKQIESVAAMRRALPQGAIMKDYVFDGPNGSKVSLADLASDGRSVVIYHCMFAEKDEHPCSMCALFVDSQNGVGKHYDQHVNFAVIAKAPYPQLEAYAKKRGWDKIRVLSSKNNDFNKVMNVENPAWAPENENEAGISVFKKDGEGNVRHLYSNGPQFEPYGERGMDLMTPLYNMLDLLPDGRGNFYAGNDYIFK
jgi:predicted dithiol-disulfide oxidoreductase (DUF899 family)